jgi:hypothetical protein
LTIDRALRRICGFPLCKKLPSEATFSRAFDEFAESKLPELVQEALVKDHRGSELIGHLSRDGTAIEARERPLRADNEVVADQADLLPARGVPAVPDAIRYKERTVAERSNARLKDEFGGRTSW